MNTASKASFTHDIEMIHVLFIVEGALLFRPCRNDAFCCNKIILKR